MKKIALLFAVMFAGLSLQNAAAQDADTQDAVAQDTVAQDAEDNATASQSFSDRYDVLISRMGLAGVGVETLLTNWEKVDPQNRKLLTAWYGFYFTKAQTIGVVPKPGKKYLGNGPVLTLKDSLDNDVNYFQETTYDDSLFRKSIEYIDKAISLYPKELYYYFEKYGALTAYEGESPDMALAGMENLVDMYYSSPSGWEYNGVASDKDFFVGAVQEFCYSFYNLGTPSSYKAFKVLSEKMLTKEKNETVFIDNIGTYYFIAEKNLKQALKYYDRALKIQPDDYTAAMNSVLISRQLKDTKLEKKYLPALIASSTDDTERAQAEARLKSL